MNNKEKLVKLLTSTRSVNKKIVLVPRYDDALAIRCYHKVTHFRMIWTRHLVKDGEVPSDKNNTHYIEVTDDFINVKDNYSGIYSIEFDSWKDCLSFMKNNLGRRFLTKKEYSTSIRYLDDDKFEWSKRDSFLKLFQLKHMNGDLSEIRDELLLSDEEIKEILLLGNSTSYFSFGTGHKHNLYGKSLGVDQLVKLSTVDPRNDMFMLFDRFWSFQYDELPEMKYFRGGIVDMTDTALEVRYNYKFK